MEVDDGGWQQGMNGYGFNPVSDANPDSGSMGDLRVADCRADLWRMADAPGAARGTGAGRGNAAPAAREPVEAAGRNVTSDWILRESVRA